MPKTFIAQYLTAMHKTGIPLNKLAMMLFKHCKLIQMSQTLEECEKDVEEFISNMTDPQTQA